MIGYQVVAVYPSGRRYPVREPHETIGSALAHRDRAIRALDRDRRPGEDWTYAVDVRYIGADGQLHWRGNVDAPVTSCTL